MTYSLTHSLTYSLSDNLKARDASASKNLKPVTMFGDMNPVLNRLEQK